MQDFTTLVFSPCGHPDPGLAIAACRFGAVGVLDVGSSMDDSSRDRALATLAVHAHNPFGLALSGTKAGSLGFLGTWVDRGLQWLIVDPQTAAREQGDLEGLRNAGVRVLIELVGMRAESDPYTFPNADGFVLKGHESGGWVGEETAFILLQWALKRGLGPLYVRGGIGLHTAAACAVAGAAGIVLDHQLLLLRESPLRETLSPLLAGCVGTEFVLLGDPASGPAFRTLDRPGLGAVKTIRQQLPVANAGQLAEAIAPVMGWDDPTRQLMPLGQDAAMAVGFAERFHTLAQFLGELNDSIRRHISDAANHAALAPGGPLAKALGTRVPVVQGPMTRVSDVAGFAQDVAQGGGLPMVALALLRGERLEQLLSETSRLLGKHPWGVGILGFAPAELRAEQIAATLRHKPAYAIVAGGRPDQVLELERQGIPGFLHVPSPRLLSLFLDQGAKRFIFEGRECGGHVGPLSSFVLWESMVDTLLRDLPKGVPPETVEVLFAGGVHDDLSAAMVATLAAPLSARGIRIGILVGTAYLFTREIVQRGAIVRNFQKTAVACKRTVTLESGPGHATRGADTPFARQFLALREQLQTRGESAEVIREALEDLNLGKLRVASKGLERTDGSKKLRKVPVAEQSRTGMYMIGQAAALRDQVVSITELHEQLSAAAQLRIDAKAREYETRPARVGGQPTPRPAEIAIIGIGAFLPGAPDAETFWENVVEGRDAIGEIPAHRWDWRLYFDPDRQAPDRIYSRWGGFLEDMPFNPLRFGLPPKVLPHIDPLQLMTLEVADRTLADAGYADRPFARDRSSVILGASGGAGDVGAQYAVRSETPRFAGHLPEEMASRLPEWSEDSFAGILLNVSAGRAANRLDFGGVNFTVDSACASSLTAVYQGIVELEDGRSDLVIAGGVDTVQGPFGYLCFSKTQALSPRGRCRTFDASADGIVISEGIAMVALKRLRDAERDGDRIYAVIQGYGGSSDGRARSMTAPHPDGQIRALQRAYAKAGYGPESVAMFEAHGTGTVAGDSAELETVTRLLRDAGAGPRQAMIGSVKTLIGHTKATAGVAGLIKSALSLHRRVLPPHRNVETPNPRLADAGTPLYLALEARPWIRSNATPRRASVSAFGFGGTNFHLTLEEYNGDFLPGSRPAPVQRWPSELCVWAAADRAGLGAALERVRGTLLEHSALELRDLAAGLEREAEEHLAAGTASVRAAVVATNPAELRAGIDALLEHLRSERPGPLPANAFFRDEPLGAETPVAVLFPGQGSQYPGMLRELSLIFPDLAEALAEAEHAVAMLGPLDGHPIERLSSLVYPPAAFEPETRSRAQAALTRTQYAQPALGALGHGIWRLLEKLGLRAAMMAGHSYGEYLALSAAGAMDRTTLLQLSAVRGRSIIEAAAAGDLGTMVAVEAPRPTIEAWLREHPELVLANHNGPSQSVISGPATAIAAFIQKHEGENTKMRRLPVAAAFHSRLVAPAREVLDAAILGAEMQAPAVPVYANSSGAQYPRDMDGIRDTLCRHLESPVEFVANIEAMYQQGARIFVEAGPRSVLTGLARRILGDRPHRALAIDDQQGGLRGMLRTLGALWSEGLPLRLSPLFSGRSLLPVDFAAPDRSLRQPSPGPHDWLLNGSGARPAGAPAPKPLALSDVQATARRTATPPQSEPLPPTRERPQTQSRARPREALEEFQPMPYGPPSRTQTYPPPSDGVLEAYQETMRQFLQVQESVMLAYLGQPSARRMAIPRTPASASTQGMPLPLPAADPPAAGGPRPFGEMTPATRPQPVDSAPPAAAPVASGPGARSAASPRPATLPPVAHPAAPPPAPDPDPAPAGSGTPDFEQLLLGIVEERTGYPRDMLDPDQNLEADLGIDSIKRVEIIGALLKALPEMASQSQASEALNSQKTLNGMLAWLREQGGRETTAPTGAEESSRPFDVTGPAMAGGRTPPLARFIMGTSSSDSETNTSPDRSPLTAGVYVILGTDDALSRALAASITAAGGTPHAILLPAAMSAERVAEAAAAARTQGTIRGLISLTMMGAKACNRPNDHELWRSETALHNHTLMLWLQELAPALQSRGRVLVASALGGAWGRRGSGTDLTAQGAACGLLKSLREEWPQVRAVAVDLDPGRPASEWVSSLMDELSPNHGRIEVGFPGGRRHIFRAEPAPLESHSPARLEPSPEWVVMATGGGRGITAMILETWAAVGLTLILVGRAPEPAPETEALSACPDAAALRAHFLREIRDLPAAARLTPAQIDRKVRAVLQDRELRENLTRIRALGARVEYHQADMRDPESVARLLAHIDARHGRLDGVIHAAGVIEDRLLCDKTLDSWIRVFETKAASTWNLATHLRPEGLKFLALFASVAGRFGNRGQTDYAAANELITRIAWSLHARWAAQGVRVVSIHWGPWSGTGMVSDEVRRKFEARGVELIQVDQGRRFFFDEITRGPLKDVEVIAGQGPWERHEAEMASPTPDAPNTVAHTAHDGAAGSDAITGDSIRVERVVTQPLLGATRRLPTAADGTIRLERILDRGRDLFLDEHPLDGIPVLPAAAALELMAEGAAEIWPGWQITQISDFRQLRGVRLTATTMPLILKAKASTHGDSAGFSVSLSLHPEGNGPPFYRATAQLSTLEPTSPTPLPRLQLPASPRSAGACYREWLFHGPRLQTVTRLRGIGPEGILAEVRQTPVTDWYPDNGGQWLFDPGVIDAAAQLILVWSRLHWDKSALPNGIDRITRYGEGPLGNCRMQMQLHPIADTGVVRADVGCIEMETDRLRLWIEGLECTASQALNRLGGGWSGEITVA